MTEEKRGRGRPKAPDQVVVINSDWEIRRLDKWNWRIFYKGKWHEKSYYTLVSAFRALPDKMLGEAEKNDLSAILGLLRGIEEDISKALP